MATQDKSVYIDKTSGSEQMYRVFNSNRMGMVPTGPWELPDDHQREGRLRRGADCRPSTASR